MSVLIKVSERTYLAPLVTHEDLLLGDELDRLHIRTLLQTHHDQYHVAVTKLRLAWEATARDKQLPPADLAWATWLIMSGRGWGKTNVGASTTALFALENPNTRCAIIAPTAADIRDTCMEGVSGLVNTIPPICFKGGSRDSGYNRSLSEVFLANGSIIKGFAATEPERLRGPQHHWVWGDEIAVWKYLEETIDNMLFGLRLGEDPKVIYTTTPRPIKKLREIRDEKGTVLTVGHMLENAGNLAPKAVERLLERYEGTRLGRQELSGELLEDTPGALWTQERINAGRITSEEYDQIEIRRVVIGVDPAASATGAETGIVACARDNANHGYVLGDYSLRGKPEAWAAAAVRAFYEWKADCIVAEVNNGGDMVESVIRAVDPNVPVKKVHATRGKARRAEPISTMAEQGRWHHVGQAADFAKLEGQMTSFVPGDEEDQASPDRMDAHVWAGHELFFSAKETKVGATSF